MARRREIGEGYRIALADRDRELFATRGAAWFGREACLTPPNDRERDAGGTYLVVRRGWIESVTCTLAAFAGGPCPGCIETGENDDGDPRCRLCNGTGRTEGIGMTLVSSQPIEKVVVPGVVRQGRIFRGSGEGDIPDELFGLLREGRLETGPGGTLRRYTDEQVAVDDLSAALIRKARVGAVEAGLVGDGMWGIKKATPKNASTSSGV